MACKDASKPVHFHTFCDIHSVAFAVRCRKRECSSSQDPLGEKDGRKQCKFLFLLQRIQGGVHDEDDQFQQHPIDRLGELPDLWEQRGKANDRQQFLPDLRKNGGEFLVLLQHLGEPLDEHFHGEIDLPDVWKEFLGLLFKLQFLPNEQFLFKNGGFELPDVSQFLGFGLFEQHDPHHAGHEHRPKPKFQLGIVLQFPKPQ